MQFNKIKTLFVNLNKLYSGGKVKFWSKMAIGDILEIAKLFVVIILTI